MAEFEKDFIMRQTKDMAKALAKFMEKDDVDDLLKLDEKHTDQVEDHVDVDAKIAEELVRLKGKTSERRTEIIEED
ncbi:hypothetical protein I6N95_00560 [Vagococcus sp. BWB3-3]|uniref:Uncharacterized protein n=1 Tax=Vagococcus allomyrinae TaxID=2794353 RepID=A0A940P9U1_9ENTE|nr:hypothetical protein [Vagococcus allomyrinae]MBP1039486.1 hypothetical protein [Vagococcus allomyrinae]